MKGSSMNTQAPVITIDGPSGAGKGTVCARLAQVLNWQLLDSGALYRITGLAASRKGLALDHEAAVAAVAAALDVRFEPTRSDERRVGRYCTSLSLALRDKSIVYPT